MRPTVCVRRIHRGKVLIPDAMLSCVKRRSCIAWPQIPDIAQAFMFPRLASGSLRVITYCDNRTQKRVSIAIVYAEQLDIARVEALNHDHTARTLTTMHG